MPALPPSPSAPPLRTVLGTPPGVLLAVGELDVVSAGHLGAAVRTLADRCTEVTLDLSGVTFIDGAGVGALLAARRSVIGTGGSLRLRTPHERVRRVLRLTHLEDLFTIDG